MKKISRRYLIGFFTILYLAVYITLAIFGKPVTWEKLSFLVPAVVFIWGQLQFKKAVTWNEFWASRKWKEPAFLLIVVDTLIFPLVDIICTAFDLNLVQIKSHFYLYINLAIGLITGGIIEERKHRFKKKYPTRLGA
jgi:hypothetical protein